MSEIGMSEIGMSEIQTSVQNKYLGFQSHFQEVCNRNQTSKSKLFENQKK